MRFDINDTNSTNIPYGLEIKLFEHEPSKRNTLMDTDWTCFGYALHNKGGPFFIAASKKKENILATFTGKHLFWKINPFFLHYIHPNVILHILS